MANRCCSKCFSDKNLKKKINSKGTIQRCTYCRSNEESAIDINNLFDFIHPLIDVIETIYEEDSDGIPIAEILNNEFKLFNASANYRSLITDALSKHRTDLLAVKYKTLSNELDNGWNELKKELIEKNRFFPQTTLYKDAFLENGSLFNIFTNVIEELNYIITPADQLYRSRISEYQLTIEDMKQPPKDIVSFGRANPDGIPYLYAAENLETSLLEVRPTNGQQVNICSLSPLDDFKVIDLRTPRQNISFLSLAENDDDFDFKDILKLVNLLEAFSRELSIPVLPNRSRLDYIPTQFITEFFKNISDLKGLMFKSSFGEGFNIVIFDPILIDWTDSTRVMQKRIKGIHLTH